MKRTRRVVPMALPAAVAAAALLCLAGGAYARGAADQALAVAVDGPGTITDDGISCRDGTGDCVELYADGTSVTLTASPDAGATFAGWGGDCSGATGTTCTLTMNSAKAVTATFTADPGSGNPTLTVTATDNGEATGSGNAATLTVAVAVTGNGKVTGPGINCGNGSTDCSEPYATGMSVTLTETPDAGAIFGGWGGSCTGSGTVCTLSMTTSKSVTASFGMDSPKAVSGSFSRPVSRSSNTFATRSLGRPIVVRTAVGWAVTLRFFTSRSAAALVRVSLKGRFVNAYTFNPRAGNVLVGPFKVARSGAYRFRLTLSDGRGGVSEIDWNLCLSSISCG